MKALKKQQIAVILVLSVILSTFAAVTPVSAATLSAQQYLEKMDIAASAPVSAVVSIVMANCITECSIRRPDMC